MRWHEDPRLVGRYGVHAGEFRFNIDENNPRRSIPAAKFRHSGELNGATKAALNSPLNDALRTQRRSRRKTAGARSTSMFPTTWQWFTEAFLHWAALIIFLRGNGSASKSELFSPGTFFLWPHELCRVGTENRYTAR